MEFNLSPLANTSNTASHQNYMQQQQKKQQQQLQLPYQNTNGQNVRKASTKDERKNIPHKGASKHMVSDDFAKDSRQLLLAYLYEYLRANGMEESAKSLLIEGDVPTNGLSTNENYDNIDYKMSLDHSDTFLLEWWSSLWTMQATANPNMNQTLNQANPNMKKNPMPPPTVRQGLNMNMAQYQQQLKLQQMRLQFQQQQAHQGQQTQQTQQAHQAHQGQIQQAQQALQAQQAQQAQQVQQQQHLQSPLMVNGQPQQPQMQLQNQMPQQHQQRPLPQAQELQPSQSGQVQHKTVNNDAINDYQLNLLMMENQNNIQKRQFMLMKQQRQQQLPHQQSSQLPHQLQPIQANQMEAKTKDLNANTLLVSQRPLQPQQQSLLQQQQQQQQHLQQQLLMMQQQNKGVDAYQTANNYTKNTISDIKPNSAQNNSIEATNDDPNLTAQQRNQFNLQYQLQQERLKYIQQQQAMLGNLDINASAILNSTSFNNDLSIDDDWLSGMGAGPGFI